jgi:hypothetical protein
MNLIIPRTQTTVEFSRRFLKIQRNLKREITEEERRIINKQKEERIKSIVSPDSPFYSLYARTASLENFLSIPVMSSFSPPTFRDALDIYRNTEVLSVRGLSDRAGLSYEGNVLTRILSGWGI